MSKHRSPRQLRRRRARAARLAADRVDAVARSGSTAIGEATWDAVSATLAARLPAGSSFEVARSDPRSIVVDVFGLAGPLPALEVAIRAGDADVQVALRAHERGHSFALRRLLPARYSGVHPGAAFDVPIGDRRLEHGAICALLAPRDDAGEPTHFLTCGHVFPPPGGPRVVVAALHEGAEAKPIGILVRNLLAEEPRRDVALVELYPRGRQLARVSTLGPPLIGHLEANAVFGRRARAWRPTRRGYSDEVGTGAGPFHGHVDDPTGLWPGGFRVDGVIRTTAAISAPGDSGAVLATVDPAHPVALGSCTASDDRSSLFEPIGRALAALASTHPLTIWRRQP